MVNRICLLLCTLLLTACASVGGRNEYQGPDAGVAALSLGARPTSAYQSFTLLFRKAGAADAQPAGRFTYFHSNFFSKQKKDYDTREEQGAVVSVALPPGDYEIYDFEIFLNAGTVQNTYRSRRPFSIPFTVAPGKLTYLGSYQAYDVRGRNFLGLPVPAGAVFVVRDRHESDLRLLNARIPDLPSEIVNATPAAAKLGSPAFVNTPPAP